MASEDRPADPALSHELAPIPDVRRFEFGQLVQLIERYYRPSTLVGFQGHASDERLRFRPEVSFGFPATDVAEVDALSSEEGEPAKYRVTTTFLGLYGSTSPLPSFYTEQILADDEGADRVRAFLDLFHHRLLSLFYRCWAKYRYAVGFSADGSDAFTRRVMALVGLGTPGLAEQTGIPAIRLLRYAGLLTQLPPSAAALEAMLRDAFDGVPVCVEPCTGRWARIAPSQRALLGRRNTTLGVDCTVGEAVFSRSDSFRICMGPMPLLGSLSTRPMAKDALALNTGSSVKGSTAPLSATTSLTWGR
jgi:type VI secretion system protein ImpH